MKKPPWLALLLTFAHILREDLDILVAVRARVLVVEAERVHDLVHGAARAAEAVAVLTYRPLQRQLLPPPLPPDVGPATVGIFSIFSCAATL